MLQLSHHLDEGLFCRRPGQRREASGVTVDSRRVEQGFVFVACEGATATSADGHQFLPDVIAKGASAVVVRPSQPVPEGPFWVFETNAPRVTAARLAELHHGRPSAQIPLVGITGTNGKTTTSFLSASLLSALGQTGAVFGTLGVGAPSAPKTTGFTTPEAETISRELRDLVDANFSSVFMEVSSHALATARVDGLQFRGAVFTNFTQDHLDYHGTMAAYANAKLRLFEERLDDSAFSLVSGVVVRSLRQMFGDARIDRLQKHDRFYTFGIDETSDFSARSVNITRGETRFDFHCGVRSAIRNYSNISVPLVGYHNLENALCAIGSAVLLGHDPNLVVASLSAMHGAPGRFEIFRINETSPLVIVDYAHTPDALERVVALCRSLMVPSGRLTVVFGCGGDRDKSKRPLMGRAAAAADIVVVTDDNPRTENAETIRAAAGAGARAAGKRDGVDLFLDADRKHAIEKAIERAAANDVVLLAGKGHETTMTIGKDHYPFDDRVVAKRALEARA